MTFEKKNLHPGRRQVLYLPGLRRGLDGSLHLVIATPGLINAFVLMALVVDQRPRIRPVATYPDITLLVAAYNEAGSIAETVHSVFIRPTRGAPTCT